jgi:hypothetical protein
MPTRPIPFNDRRRGPGQFSGGKPQPRPSVPAVSSGGQTAAAMALFRAPPQLGSLGISFGGRKRRRKRRVARVAKRRVSRRSSRRSSRRRARLVKGSAAARRYMAKLRAMRKRR